MVVLYLAATLAAFTKAPIKPVLLPSPRRRCAPQQRREVARISRRVEFREDGVEVRVALFDPRPRLAPPLAPNGVVAYEACVDRARQPRAQLAPLRSAHVAQAVPAEERGLQHARAPVLQDEAREVAG